MAFDIYNPKVNHSDYPQGVSEKDARRLSIQHAVEYVGPSAKAVELGFQVYEVSLADMIRRKANNAKSAEAIGEKLSRPRNIAHPMGTVAANHFYFLAALKKRHRGELSGRAAMMLDDTKGLGHELGHVQQFGNFGAARILDEEVRNLPKLDGSGKFKFTRIDEFNDPDHDGLKYDFRGVADPGHPGRFLVVGQRNRPAADVETPYGTVELFRKSIFLVHHPEAYALLDEANGHDTELPQTKEMKELCQQVGRQTIGAALRYKSFSSSEDGQVMPTIVPVSSTYIELARHSDNT